jgi:hypothetical protein
MPINWLYYHHLEPDRDPALPKFRTVQSDNPRDWYQLERHRKRAKHQLQLEPFCRFCAREGKAIPARIADHVHPHKGDWNSFRMGELQSLCPACHSSTKALIEQHGCDPRIGIDGFPIDKAHPVYGHAPAAPIAAPFNVDDLIQ